MSYAKNLMTDVRRRKRLQAEALSAARAELYRQRPTFGEPASTLDAGLVLEEAERIMEDHWRRCDYAPTGD